MSLYRTSSILTAALATSSALASAEKVPPPTTASSSWHPSVETSPQFFVMNGWAVGTGLRTDRHPRLRASAAAFALDIPDVFLGDHKEMGWRRRDVGASLGAQYFAYQPSDHRGGAALGLLVAAQRKTFRNGGERDTVDELAVMAQVAYQWYPTAHGLYLMPWIGVGVPVVSSDDAVANGLTFEPDPITIVPAAFVGWEL